MIDAKSPLFPFINRLFEADCLECMKDIPDESIDMILCDLPYGITQNQWDCYVPLDKLWEQYKRIIKPNGAIVLDSKVPKWRKWCWASITRSISKKKYALV